VREYVFSPSNHSASDLSTSGNTVNLLTEKKGHDPAASSSSLADSVSTAADAMRLGIVGHPVAAVSGALALAVLQRLVGKRKRRLRSEVEDVAGDNAKGMPFSQEDSTPEGCAGPAEADVECFIESLTLSLFRFVCRYPRLMQHLLLKKPF
jgi:hypothetical protein